MWPTQHLIYTTQQGTKILVSKGGKSQFNFKVQYQEPGKAIRTPKHIHLIIDLYMKKTGNKELTMKLVDHIINNIILKVQSSVINPPQFQIFTPDHVEQFKELNNYGEYPIDFLLVITELIMIQEKTNYPSGVLNLNLFKAFREEKDIFSVVGAATFRGSIK